MQPRWTWPLSKTLKKLLIPSFTLHSYDMKIPVISCLMSIFEFFLTSRPLKNVCTHKNMGLYVTLSVYFSRIVMATSPADARRVAWLRSSTSCRCQHKHEVITEECGSFPSTHRSWQCDKLTKNLKATESWQSNAQLILRQRMIASFLFLASYLFRHEQF